MRAAVRSWHRPGRAGEIHNPPGPIGYDLHVHAVVTVLVRVAGPAVAHTVALGERPVEQYILRVVLAQNFEQAEGEEDNDRGGVGVGRADRASESGGDLGQDASESVHPGARRARPQALKPRGMQPAWQRQRDQQLHLSGTAHDEEGKGPVSPRT